MSNECMETHATIRRPRLTIPLTRAYSWNTFLGCRWEYPTAVTLAYRDRALFGMAQPQLHMADSQARVGRFQKPPAVLASLAAALCVRLYLQTIFLVGNGATCHLSVPGLEYWHGRGPRPSRADRA